MVSKSVGLMLDLCDRGILEQGAGDTGTVGVAPTLAACVMVKKAGEAVE